MLGVSFKRQVSSKFQVSRMLVSLVLNPSLYSTCNALQTVFRLSDLVSNLRKQMGGPLDDAGANGLVGISPLFAKAASEVRCALKMLIPKPNPKP